MASIHKDLTSALAQMTWQIEPGTFALLGFQQPPTTEDIKLLAQRPAQIIVEEEESTLLIPSAQLPEALLLHPDATVEEDLIWIRFDAPMSWDVVGFLAWISVHFAAANIPIGAVCGFHRDHLFLAQRHEQAARTVLESILPAS